MVFQTGLLLSFGLTDEVLCIQGPDLVDRGAFTLSTVKTFHSITHKCKIKEIHLLDIKCEHLRRCRTKAHLVKRRCLDLEYGKAAAALVMTCIILQPYSTK
jgi:hypothetical protein